MKKQKITINMVSESDISVQGHGVHTAYVELANALEKRSDTKLIRGKFGKTVDCDIVHIHTIGPRTWRKLLQKGPKKVVSAHVILESLVGSLVLAKYWKLLAKIYMSWYYKRADKVLAVSKTVANALINDLGVSKDKVEVFYNSIDMSYYKSSPSEKLRLRDNLGIQSGKFVVIGNGQVQPRKRVDVFVKMAKANPEIQFFWIGGIPFKRLGSDYNKMSALMKNTPKNLTITGVIPHNQVRDYLHAADVFCLPAEQENHPMCVLEAAGAGLPIVLRGMPEYKDTFYGDALMCDDDSFDGEIIKLRNNKEFYKKWKEKSKNIADRFDSKTAATKVLSIYKELI